MAKRLAIMHAMNFFSDPETISEQKARIAREAAAAKAKADRAALEAGAQAPIKGRPVDTTGDLFARDQSAAPLFATTNKQNNKH